MAARVLRESRVQPVAEARRGERRASVRDATRLRSRRRAVDVAPFILRGVSLLGIDSVGAPRDLRRRTWDRLGRDLNPARLDDVTREIGLIEVLGTAQAVLDGKVRGRLIVEVQR